MDAPDVPFTVATVPLPEMFPLVKLTTSGSKLKTAEPPAVAEAKGLTKLKTAVKAPLPVPRQHLWPRFEVVI